MVSNVKSTKEESIVISHKSIEPLHLPLTVNQHDMQEVSGHKHLGIIISNNGARHDHIDYIVKKACQRLNIIS